MAAEGGAPHSFGATPGEQEALLQTGDAPLADEQARSSSSCCCDFLRSLPWIPLGLFAGFEFAVIFFQKGFTDANDLYGGMFSQEIHFIVHMCCFIINIIMIFATVTAFLTTGLVKDKIAEAELMGPEAGCCCTCCVSVTKFLAKTGTFINMIALYITGIACFGIVASASAIVPVASAFYAVCKVGATGVAFLCPILEMAKPGGRAVNNMCLCNGAPDATTFECTKPGPWAPTAQYLKVCHEKNPVSDAGWTMVFALILSVCALSMFWSVLLRRPAQETDIEKEAQQAVEDELTFPGIQPLQQGEFPK